MSLRKQVLAELERLRTAHGGVLKKDDIVQAAMDKKNPLHGEFTWDKAAGWRKNLLAEAGELIRCYYIVTEAPKPMKIRAFVSLSTDRSNGGGYRGISDVLSDDQMRAVMLEDALRELAFFEAKYRAIKELSPVFIAADEVRGGKKKKAA